MDSMDSTACVSAAEGTAVTDTPIYDQIRDELSMRRESEQQSTGKRAERGATSTVSVWALVDANRDAGGRRRR